MRIRNLLIVGAAVMTMGWAGTSAWALPHVFIGDVTDGLPTVDTDLSGLQIRFGYEEVLLTGLVPIMPGYGITPGSITIVLREPWQDPSGNHLYSDFVTLTASAPDVNTPGLQPITIFFQSDGAANFDYNVVNPLGATTTTDETGAVQDLSGWLVVRGFLTVTLQSDFNSSEVPDGGATVVLLGFALGALGVTRRVRKCLIRPS